METLLDPKTAIKKSKIPKMIENLNVLEFPIFPSGELPPGRHGLMSRSHI
jgi:hypothetical protein